MWLYLLLRGFGLLVLAAFACAVAALVAIVWVVVMVATAVLALVRAGAAAVREPETYRHFRARRVAAALDEQPIERRADDPSANPRWRRR